jgi:hypothetical protein
LYLSAHKEITMTKMVAALLAVGALAGPAASYGAPPSAGRPHARTVARQQCTAERKLLGVKGFRLKYGAPDAFRKCVRAHLPSDRQAATQCRAERRQIGAKAFRLKYGGPVPLNRCIKASTTP